jgi:hypothetical protein
MLPSISSNESPQIYVSFSKQIRANDGLALMAQLNRNFDPPAPPRPAFKLKVAEFTNESILLSFAIYMVEFMRFIFNGANLYSSLLVAK